MWRWLTYVPCYAALVLVDGTRYAVPAVVALLVVIASITILTRYRVDLAAATRQHHGDPSAIYLNFGRRERGGACCRSGGWSESPYATNLLPRQQCRTSLFSRAARAPRGNDLAATCKRRLTTILCVYNQVRWQAAWLMVLRGTHGRWLRRRHSRARDIDRRHGWLRLFSSIMARGRRESW